MKKLNWQAKNEKILYFSRENIIFYLIRIFNKIFIFIWLILFISFLAKFLNNYYLLFLIIFIIIIWFILSYIFWYNTYFVVTNKRLVKYIRSWIFTEHNKELKLDQLNELTYSIRWIYNKLFNVWNIKIVWKDKENVIYFTWIKNPDEVVQYISRLRDFLFENPDYDFNDLKEFKSREKRKW